MKTNTNKLNHTLETILENMALVEAVLLQKIHNHDLDLSIPKTKGIVAVLDHAAGKLSIEANIEYQTESR